MDIEKKLEEVQTLAAENEAVIYNIHFCNAGIGITWHEKKGSRNFRDDLVTHTYYKSLSECIAGELTRLSGGGG